MINFVRNLFSKPKYKIHRSKKDNNFYFSLIAKNGEIILTSEGYLARDGAINGINSVSIHGKNISNFEIKESKDKKYYFILIARNNKIIGTSEMYNQKDSALNGIESVMSCCTTNVIKFDE